MAGAALDPLAELWVFVFANNGDFDAYQPRLSRYHRSVEAATVEAAVSSLHALYEEVGRREARLAELGAKKVTRPLAEKHPDLRPLVALFSECHELFGDPNHGREAADLAVQTMRRARKTAITLAFDTQSARADAIRARVAPLWAHCPTSSGSSCSVPLAPDAAVAETAKEDRPAAPCAPASVAVIWNACDCPLSRLVSTRRLPVPSSRIDAETPESELLIALRTSARIISAAARSDTNRCWSAGSAWRTAPWW